MDNIKNKRYYEYVYKIDNTNWVEFFDGEKQLKYLYDIRGTFSKIQWKTCFIAEEIADNYGKGKSMRKIFPFKEDKK